ncbi:MAG TPA: DUF4352 domain-containing protein [Actinomycetales bacterium]|nr:DUF4352 domain-containing protein [Actinomycetales bacterium]
MDEKKGLGTGAKVGIIGGSLLLLMVACSAAVAGGGGGADEVDEVAVAEPAAEEAPAEPVPSEAPTEEPAPISEPAPEVAVAGIGAPVRDGKFEFVVNGLECGVGQIGEEFFNVTPQGQFCLVDMTITNIGDQAQTFFGDNTYVYNDADQQYSADTEAGFYMDESNSFIEEINPGNQLRGKVVFDVPAGAVLDRIELHDSAFSGGVEVALR